MPIIPFVQATYQEYSYTQISQETYLSSKGGFLTSWILVFPLKLVSGTRDFRAVDLLIYRSLFWPINIFHKQYKPSRLLRLHTRTETGAPSFHLQEPPRDQISEAPRLELKTH